MPDNQDKSHPSTQQEIQPDQAKPISGQYQEQSSVSRLIKKQHSVFHSLLGVLVLVVVSAGTSNCGSKASNYAELSKRLANEKGLILDESVRKQLKQDADSGDSGAQALMASCLMDGSGGFNVDQPQALTYARQSAQAGNSYGMSRLGKMYATGQGGLAQNEEEAVKWYRKSAEAGDSYGMNNLGVMYASSLGGLAKNDVEAVKWYRKSAEAGNSVGMLNLGTMYELGSGIAMNQVEAVKWYKKSAEAGNTDGMVRLGFCSFQDTLSRVNIKALTGNDLEALKQEELEMNKRLQEAVKWFKKSAEAGNSTGMVQLGKLYNDGQGGLAKNAVEAVNWFKKSAEAGNPDGMCSLGDMYMYGRGGLKANFEEAIAWYRKAAKLGDIRGETRLDFIKMNPKFFPPNQP